VIGVVGDAKNDSLQRAVKPTVFLPYSFALPPDESLFVRASGDPDTTIHSIRQRLRELSSELIVAQSPNYTLTWRLDTQGWGQERFIATLFGLFAVLALALAATGLYSVVSFVVTQRTQELGIRMALGARRGNVVQLVLSSTVATLGVGIAGGVKPQCDSQSHRHGVRGWQSPRPGDAVRGGFGPLLCRGDSVRVSCVACRLDRSDAGAANGIARKTCKLLKSAQTVHRFVAPIAESSEAS